MSYNSTVRTLRSYRPAPYFLLSIEPTISVTYTHLSGSYTVLEVCTQIACGMLRPLVMLLTAQKVRNLIRRKMKLSSARDSIGIKCPGMQGV